MKMAIKNDADGTYSCSYCGKVFVDPFKADECRDSHELIYIPFTKKDLNRLVEFIYLKDDSLLTPSLIKILTKRYRKPE
jgi:hypothetical protein